MPSRVPDKLAAIITEIDRAGCADVLRLTILKRWFESPGRLRAFGYWVAERALDRGENAEGEEAQLFAAAHALFAAGAMSGEGLPYLEAEQLYRRLRLFQSDYKRIHSTPMRMIKNWNLMLTEEGLALYLGIKRTPYDGYHLAVNRCKHYSPSHGEALDRHSQVELTALLDFVKMTEAGEAGDDKVIRSAVLRDG
jgi:hypothetical protein